MKLKNNTIILQTVELFNNSAGINAILTADARFINFYLSPEKDNASHQYLMSVNKCDRHDNQVARLPMYNDRSI